MIQLRIKCFETNSSSTHTMTICSEKDYEDWKAGKLMFNLRNKKFIENCPISNEDLEEYYRSIKKSWFKDFYELGESELQDLRDEAVENGITSNFNNSDLYTYDEYWDNDELEGYVEKYTSESGDRIVIFGEYGYDG